MKALILAVAALCMIGSAAAYAKSATLVLIASSKTGLAMSTIHYDKVEDCNKAAENAPKVAGGGDLVTVTAFCL